VTDNMTGLIWLKDANCPNGTKTWPDAISYTNGLYDGCPDCGGTDNDCGLSDGSISGDWRLPNRKELESLIHLGFYNPCVPNTAGTAKRSESDPFTGVQSYYYWSATSYASNTGAAWIVLMQYGQVEADYKTSSVYVWPVRGGQ
jgi:hypothetical protein